MLFGFGEDGAEVVQSPQGKPAAQGLFHLRKEPEFPEDPSGIGRGTKGFHLFGPQRGGAMARYKGQNLFPLEIFGASFVQNLHGAILRGASP